MTEIEIKINETMTDISPLFFPLPKPLPTIKTQDTIQDHIEKEKKSIKQNTNAHFQKFKNE